MIQLSQQECRPCQADSPPLTNSETKSLLNQLHPDWEICDLHHLKRHWTFSNFVTALVFVNRVGDLAESEGHHPNISFSWGKAIIEIYTHKINGLTENDFILASKIDLLPTSVG